MITVSRLGHIDQSDTNARIQQLYSLLQPHWANAQALVDRWDRDNPLQAMAEEAVAPKEFRELVQRVSDLPIGEVAALLEAAIAADKGVGDPPDLERATDVLSRVDAQVRSATEDIEAFADKRMPLPAPLSSELQRALKTEQARLERGLAAARARMITDGDLRILRHAKVPPDTIDAIVRDAPNQDDIDQLTTQLEELQQLLTVSTDAARFAEQLGRLEVFTNAALGLLGPILDPMLMQQLHDLVQPLLNPDAGRPRAD